MTGMISGMDTESIVSQLVQAKSTKVDKLKGDKQKIEWKQEIWKDLNSKLYSFYSKSLDNIRTKGSFNKMKASIVDTSIASVSANNTAVTGTQTLAVKQLAKSGYITGGKINNPNANKGDYSILALDGVSGNLGSGADIKLTIGDKEETLTLTSSMTLNDVANLFSEKGLNANYDATNQRFFISSKESGAAANFRITATDEASQSVLDALGLSANGRTAYTDNNGAEWSIKDNGDGTYSCIDSEGNEDSTKYNSIEELLQGAGLTATEKAGGWTKIEGQDAIIELNGAEFSSSTNSFNINGLSVTAQKVSESYIEDGKTRYVTTNVSTDKDVDAIYNMIKDFFKEYNDLIKEMDTRYNADSAKDYNVLSEDEKSSMSEEEIEKWNEKIKDSLLRRDDNLSSDINMFKDAMSQSFMIYGTRYSLSSFGINTLSYFLAGDNEKGVFHIDGDPDDTNTSGQPDKLKEMIGSNLEDVTDFFHELADGLYQKITAATKHSDYRSVYSMYDDKTLQKEYDDMEKDISDEEQKLADLEDKYYDQFSAMETALAKLQDKQNALGQLLGSS